jgi:hypothetical protein
MNIIKLLIYIIYEIGKKELLKNNSRLFCFYSTEQKPNQIVLP